MTDDELRDSFDRDVEISIGLAVPRELYEGAAGHLVWWGRFTVRINERNFSMAVTPSTLFVNETDPTGPVANLVGSEWVVTTLGKLFHADYISPRVNGGFQIFRKDDLSPFQGFESVEHTHMLVYMDGSGDKQYFPVTIGFSAE